MNAFISAIIDWSEVWAPLIPLAVLLIYKQKQNWEKPILIYLIITLLVNFCVDFLYLPFMENKILTSNYIFYNINSIVRFIFFTWFFNCIHPFFRRMNMVIPALFFLLVILNFIFIESIFDFSSKMMALETAVLLSYCIMWFYHKIREDESGSLFSSKYSLIITGISIYTSVNFVLFLFYKILIRSENAFAYYIWDVHNFFFIIMCVFIAIAFKK